MEGAKIWPGWRCIGGCGGGVAPIAKADAGRRLDFGELLVGVVLSSSGASRGALDNATSLQGNRLVLLLKVAALL